MTGHPKMYSSLARWFALLTPPGDYEQEAAICRDLFLRHNPHTRTILELGCGGGHNAFHLKNHFAMTLSDLSPEMLAQSKKLNPECEHIRGDMRSLRLNRQFDGVFVHDAISYMATTEDLRQAIATAAEHCAPGGCVLLLPDYYRETFSPATNHGGTDGEKEGMRYLEWIYDPDPADSTYIIDFAFILRNEAGEVTVEHDRHRLGLFSKNEWLAMLRETGLEGEILAMPYQEENNEQTELHVIYARK